MKITLPIIIAGAALLVLIIAVIARFIVKRRKKRDYPDKVHQKWLNIQRLCANKKTWSLAVVKADKLLEEALKKSGYKGKTIGERLVAAQRKISDNDSVWYAHNLAKKIIDNKSMRLRESDVKKALIGFRGALRNLGVLNGK